MNATNENAPKAATFEASESNNQPTQDTASAAKRKRLTRADIAPVLDRVCRSHCWIKNPDGPRHIDEPLTEHHVKRHVTGRAAFGVCPMAPGESTTRLALLDLDNHKGEVPWAEMRATAEHILDNASRFFIFEGVMWRSSGGQGIHLFFLWDEPQDAYSVRQALGLLLRISKLKEGTGGVAKGEAEAFPKQSAIEPDKWGSMFVLPGAGQSERLTPGTEWPMSEPVPVVEKREREKATASESTTDLNKLSEILAKIPNSGECSLDYDKWRNAIFAIHHATEGSDHGLALAHEFSARSAKYDPDFLDTRVWPYITSERDSAITIDTLRFMAREYENPADDFEALPGEPRTELAAGDDDISFVDFSTLAAEPPPPRRWAVDQWLPIGTTTLLSGSGGVGKSLAAQQAGVAVANGERWLGLPTTRGPVLGLFGEDDADELKRRAVPMFKAADLDPASASGGLYLDARAGKRNALMTFAANRIGKSTMLLRQLEERCAAIRPVLVIVDNIAQVFTGSENDRAEVTAFCNRLTGLARRFECAVLLLGHPSKAAGSEFSGSTAWEAAVRTRLYLDRQADGTSILSKAKANYSATGQVTIEYRGGVFLPIAGGANAEPQAVANMKATVVGVVRVFTSRQQAVSHIATARNYLVKLMAAEGVIEHPAEKIIAAKALAALLDAGVLAPNADLGWKDSSRHPARGLAVARDEAPPETETPDLSAGVTGG